MTGQGFQLSRKDLTEILVHGHPCDLKTCSVSKAYMIKLYEVSKEGPGYPRGSPRDPPGMPHGSLGPPRGPWGVPRRSPVGFRGVPGALERTQGVHGSSQGPGVSPRGSVSVTLLPNDNDNNNTNDNDNENYDNNDTCAWTLN